MRTTANLELKLLEGSDPMGWAPLNENMEKLDTANQQMDADKLDSRVGDVLFTLRSGLGEEWLPCDGATVQAADYPALAGALSPGITQQRAVYSLAESIAATYFKAACLVHENGLWMAGGSLRKSDGKSYACVAWAQEPGGDWTFADLVSYSSSPSGVERLAWGDGVWCAMQENGRLWYASDPAGTWTRDEQSFANTNVGFLGYVDGQWLVGCGGYTPKDSDNDYYGISSVYRAQAPGETWTRHTICRYTSTSSSLTAKNNAISCAVCRGIVYQDGVYYAACGPTRIYRAEALDGTWELIADIPEAEGASHSADGGVKGLVCADGFYMLWSWCCSGSGEAPVKVLWASSPVGPWRSKVLWAGKGDDGGVSGGFAGPGGFMVCGVAYDSSSGLWNAMAAYAPRPDGAWTVKQLWTASAITSIGMGGVAAADGYLAAVGALQDTAAHSSEWRLAYGGGATRVLPTVTGVVPAYIKAR